MGNRLNICRSTSSTDDNLQMSPVEEDDISSQEECKLHDPDISVESLRRILDGKGNRINELDFIPEEAINPKIWLLFGEKCAPIHLAALLNRTDILEVLLNRGADVNIRSGVLLCPVDHVYTHRAIVN
jgi:hypothetical protein